MNDSSGKFRAPRNRTITLTEEEAAVYGSKLKFLTEKGLPEALLDTTICQDLFDACRYLPDSFVDLMVIDPPYNLTKNFNGRTFRQMKTTDYEQWADSWLSLLPRLLKPNASLYLCGDWQSIPMIQSVAERYFIIRNRITWEREKGRGALKNWKNCSEDILFCTVSSEYTFNVEAVKLKRRVMAPYTTNGQPKDWSKTGSGNFRMTYPSNVWTDLTVPYWSMPENTDHPAQKPEKMLAKIILASSNEGDVVLDPFAGSGTTAVVSRKLNRRYIGIEIDKSYCCIAEKRLALAEKEPHIQGYEEEVFWERNTSVFRKRKKGTG